MTHASVPESERNELGISDTLIRLSVGVEDEEDIIADIKQSLEAAQKVNNWSFLSQQLLSCTDIKTSSRGSSKGKQLVIFVSTTFVMY
jgi:hypothetical protein